MSSNIECPTGNPAISNTITMTVTSVPENLSVTGIVDSGQTECYNSSQTIIVAGNGTTFTVRGKETCFLA